MGLLDWFKSPEITDTTNARRFVQEHGQDVRYCYRWKSWLCWDGKRWAKDDGYIVLEKAKETARRIFEGVRGTRYDIQRAARWLGSQQALNNMVKGAASEKGIPVSPEDFDINPMILSLSNGMIDLHSQEFFPHKRELLCMKITDVEFNQESSPTWDLFLKRILPDDELRRFVQKAVGYSLTGDTSEQVLFILYGLGANGKTTFLEALRALLGDYGQHVNSDTLLQKPRGIPNDLARLQGARMVTAQEIDEGQRLSESLVKLLTGGDTVTARYLYSEFFEFKPQFKLWLATNHKPLIKGKDLGIWRRIRLIPFTVTIPLEEQDHMLSTKLKNELSGILTWALEGCRLWREEGLGMPESVILATEEYQKDMNRLFDVT